ncbi:MAG: aldehyde dehydrogenase family protein [Planctomycetota bacterium]
MHTALATQAAAGLPHLLRAATSLRQNTHAQLRDLLDACQHSVAAAAELWVETSVLAKGWRDHPHSRAEEWASGPLPVARFLSLLRTLQHHLVAGRLPELRRVATEPGAKGTMFDALPAHGLADPLLLRGYRARLECTEPNEPREPARRGDVALVLGAGNVTATPVLDVLHQVFLEGRAVLCKLSPLHSSLASTFAAALAPLVDGGLLHLCTGDGELGRDLARLPQVAAVHLTGSTATWAQLRCDPALAQKHLSAEVGCCTPAFVVPGPWRDGELQHAARQLAAFVANNGGATCVAPRLALTAASWPQRAAFLHHLRRELAALPARVPFHFAARDHFAAAAGASAASEALAPTSRSDLDAQRDSALFAREHFAPVLLELPLPGDTAREWLDRATAFARDQVFGALSCYVLAPPRVLTPLRSTLLAALAVLPHGTIAVNTWTGLGYGFGITPWGVPSGSAWQHGAGWTRGTASLRDVRRVVLEAPFRPRPLPPWLPDHRRGRATLRALTYYYLAPQPLRLAATAFHALRA